MKRRLEKLLPLAGLALASLLVAFLLPARGPGVARPSRATIAHVQPAQPPATLPPPLAQPSSAATSSAATSSAGTFTPAANLAAAPPVRPSNQNPAHQKESAQNVSVDGAAMEPDAGGYVYEESLPHESGQPSAPSALVSGGHGKPRIAIIMDDLGLNQKMTAATIALPAPLTLSFLPYARDLAAQVAKGASAGHTILLHMPMQPMGRDDPGPGALTVNLSSAEIKARVASALDAVPGAIGLNNHMGSRFTADAQGMKTVFEVLAARHLAYIDSRTTPASVGYREAMAAGIPTAARDVFLDDVIETSAIDAQLKRLVAIAKKRGWAIAIGHPYPPTVAVLTLWLPRLKAEGIEQVSVSDLLSRQSPAAPSK